MVPVGWILNNTFVFLLFLTPLHLFLRQIIINKCITNQKPFTDAIAVDVWIYLSSGIPPYFLLPYFYWQGLSFSLEIWLTFARTTLYIFMLLSASRTPVSICTCSCFCGTSNLTANLYRSGATFHRKPESIACVKLTVLLKPQSVVRVTWTMHYTVFCWLPGPISSPGTPLGILAFQCQPFYSHLCPSQIEKLSGVCSRAPSPTPSLNSEEWHFLCLVCICFSVFIALEKAFTHSISHLNVFFLRLFKN